MSTISLLATLTPSSPTRAWQTSPHPSRPLLATCYSDKSVRVYTLARLPHDASTLQGKGGQNSGLRASLHSTITGGHKRSIRSVAWKPNTAKGELVLATGSFDASVGIWRHISMDDVAPEFYGGDEDREANNDNDDDWNFAIVLDGHESEVKSVAFSAGGNFLATCSRDKSVWIWEEIADDEFETVAVCQEHDGDVKAVVWHPEEELVGSASYDDEARLWRDEGDDWGCIWRSGTSIVDPEAHSESHKKNQSTDRAGHKSTVWDLAWEGVKPIIYDETSESLNGAAKHSTLLSDERKSSEQKKEAWHDRQSKSGPRFLTCSDDMTIRVWRRKPKQRVKQNPYSVIRSRDTGEEWVQEAVLPQAHLRSIYAVSWSSRTGRVVSCGGDGRIVVYEEAWNDSIDETNQDRAQSDSADQVKTQESNGATGPLDAAEKEELNGKLEDAHITPKEDEKEPSQIPAARTKWRVVAQADAVHGVFEVNHVTWCPWPKPRQQAGFSQSDEAEEHPDGQAELIVTTGDDGDVKIWSISNDG